MKADSGKSPLALCALTVFSALLLGLLNGEHYAAQLEEEWPCTRPLAEGLRCVSSWSHLPQAHESFREGVDKCCALLWSAEDGGQGDALCEGDGEVFVPVPVPVPPPPPVVVQPAPVEPPPVAVVEEPDVQPAPEPAPQPEEPEPAVVVEEEEEPAAPEDGFCGFHQQWLGQEEAQQLVDTCPVNCRVMLMGDSLMEDLGLHFYRHLKARRGLQMILLAKFSTGLCRPDYFNWFELFPRTMDEKRPHIVLFMIGANDGQPIWFSKGNVVQTKPADKWKTAYGGRVGTLLADTRKRQALPLWVGMPVMGGKYASYLARTEEATREACAGWQVPYVDNRALLADSEGNYQSFVRNGAGKMVRVRKKDKEHMTAEGNRMLLEALMPYFEQQLRQHRLNHPELCRYPDRKDELAKPMLDIVVPYKPGR